MDITSTVWWITRKLGEMSELEPESIDENVPLSLYGLDSIARYLLFVEAQEHFDVELPLGSQADEISANELAAIISVLVTDDAS